jgi:DNA repair exonuclease SbcCD ATPase subunit
MNSLWIQKKLECDEYTIQLTCPFCHDDKLFTHKDSEKMPKYCPMCGARMDLTDASDAELVDMLQDAIKGRDQTIADLQDEVYDNKVLIKTLRTQLEEAQKDKNALGDILNRKLNTEDDILRNWQERAIKAEECAEHLDKKLDAKDEELLAKHTEYAQLRHEYDLLNAVFEDVKKVVVTIRPHEWARIAKKYNEEN